MRLILVRHGETEHNRTGLTLGRADVPLNARGRLQAAALAATFTEPPAAICTSPLARATETAAAIAAAVHVAPTVDQALIEMDVGEMEHIGRDDLRERYPDFLRLWLAAPADARMPGGETLAEVQDRVWAAITRIREQHGEDHETVVAVTHNFVILAIACRALGIPLDDFRRLKTTVAGRTVIDMGRAHATLISWNDTGHLRAAGLD